MKRKDHKLVTQRPPLLFSHLSSIFHLTFSSSHSFNYDFLSQHIMQFLQFWHPFQTLPLIPARLLLPDCFSHTFSAPPCYHGDAAVTCQFHGGDARWPVMAQNRFAGEFSWKWESTTSSAQKNEQLTGKKKKISTIQECGICLFEGFSVLFMGVADGFYRERLWVRLCW